MKLLYTIITCLSMNYSLSAQAQTDVNAGDVRHETSRKEAFMQYDKFNETFLDSSKYIYRDRKDAAEALDRWHGAAAIWCQAIFLDMAIEAYKCAKKDNDSQRESMYLKHAKQLFEGNRRQYVNFDFDNCNTNTGWFVYDDIMWWTVAFAHAYETFGDKEYLSLAEKSFERVWDGSRKVGDDGSYADPERGLGGGMFWEWQPIEHPAPHHKGDFRSACINFPTVIAATLLYKFTHRKDYLNKALEIYQWADETLVADGRVADGIHNGGPEWNDHLYNQATYIGASTLLHKITKKRIYLEKAEAGLGYTESNMMHDGILPRETGPEQGIYTAIFAQYASELSTDGFQSSVSFYEKQTYDDAYQASRLPALMLFKQFAQ